MLRSAKSQSYSTRELSTEVQQAVISDHTQALLEAVPPEGLTNVEGDIRANNLPASSLG